ncbi:MAG: hypothetical protein GX358_00785 [candidate division WS1 bacterium]|nr:hypothetical protein [candidate division WS1 bacterium]
MAVRGRHGERVFVVTLSLCFAWNLVLQGTVAAQDQKAVDIPALEALAQVSPEGFLGDLCDDVPELAPARVALANGDLDGAIAAYVGHFRARPVSHPLMVAWSAIEPATGHNTNAADETLSGFIRDGYNVHQVPESGLDWIGCPLICLTRFPHLQAVLYAAHHTGDPRYVRYTVEHVLEYMENWPIADFIGKGIEGWVDNYTVTRPWHWCMLSPRLQCLGDVVNLTRASEQVTDRERFDILHRMYQETAYMRIYMQKQVDARHNGGLDMLRAMAVACEVLSDFQVPQQWRQDNGRMAKQYLSESFYPDGMNIELTQAYSQSIAAASQTLALMLRDEPDVQELFPLMEAIAGWAIGVGKPTGSLPSYGDLRAGSFAGALNMELIELLDVPWVKTIVERTDGPEPPATVWPWPGEEAWGGLYTMRSDWSPEALYMCINGGPWGISHRHGDRLSFVVSAYGADFIIDPPSTRYHSNEPDAFVSRQAAGFLHNSITIDGVDQFEYARDEQGQVVQTVPREVTEPLDNTWEHGEDYTLWISDYSFVPILNANWERRVVFADKSYWLLQDVITGEGFAGAGQPVTIEQNFQFDEHIEIEFDGNITIATAPNGARLVLLPLEGDLQPQLSKGDTTPHTSYWPDGIPKQDLSTSTDTALPHGRGWVGRGNKLQPAPAVTYVGQVQLRTALTVAILPLKPNQELSDLVDIGKEMSDTRTLWTLPTETGALHVETSADACKVRP